MYPSLTQGKTGGVAQTTFEDALIGYPRSGNACGMCCCRSGFKERLEDAWASCFTFGVQQPGANKKISGYTYNND